jgi:biopolymer transport protein ExbD
MKVQRRKFGEPGIYEPNMTPLIDVSLVLVVILMVATPLAFQSSIAVHGASRSGKTAAEQAKVERIELVVRADGRVQVNRATAPRDSLERLLRPLILASPNSVVVLRCDDQVLHGDFVSVLDEARQLGATKIAVVGGS